jgi:hypothetical protein
MTMRTCIVEQRKERRDPAEGEVWLTLEGGSGVELVACLLDSSQNGFRVSHKYTALSSGQRVRFRHNTSCGNALVMWNRILNHQTESGFLVLDEWGPA